MSFGWEGEKIRLVPLDHDRHFERCVQWLNDPEITQWLLIGDFPITRVAEREFFDRMTKPGETEVVFAIETRDEKSEPIGATGLHNISFRHGTATSGTFIGCAGLWGRGLGSDVIRVRSHYAFDTLGLRLLLTEVMADNVRSLRALQKNGYRETGRIPARYWKRGAYRDCIQLALTRDEWLARR
jgi:RimJ/RimL family protein N-acetyltransferase